MNKTKILSVLGTSRTSNIVHSDVWHVQSLTQRSTETKYPPNINCTNNRKQTALTEK